MARGKSTADAGQAQDKRSALNSGAASAPAAVSVYPPCLTGGVLHWGDRLKNAGCDWITLSCSSTYASGLLKSSGEIDEREASKGATGFNAYLKVPVMGGMAGRSWLPRERSNAWGLDYERWEYSSNGALAAAEQIRTAGLSVDRKGKRFDMAFDFTVSEDMAAGELWDTLQPIWDHQNGLTGGPHGDGDRRAWTWYIGGKTADRRIRIYRKDLEQGNCWAEGPTMRVELVLKRELAEPVLDIWLEDKQKAVRVCAAHVESMCGLRCVEDLGEIPEREVQEKSMFGERLGVMVKQWGNALAVAAELGIDLGDLVKVKQARLSRMGRSRYRRELKGASREGVDQITASALHVIRGR